MNAPTPPPITIAPTMMPHVVASGPTSQSVVTMAMRHADHAEIVALAARLGARKAAQRQDEEHPGDEIQQCCEISVHVSPWEVRTGDSATSRKKWSPRAQRRNTMAASQVGQPSCGGAEKCNEVADDRHESEEEAEDGRQPDIVDEVGVNPLDHKIDLQHAERRPKPTQ